MNSQERKIVFVIWISLAIVAALLEITIIIYLIITKDIKSANSILLFLLQSTILGSSYILFFKKIKDEFFINPISFTKKYWISQGNGISNLEVNKDDCKIHDECIFLKKYTTQCFRNLLMFSENYLKSYYGEFQFELSIFRDQKNPYIISYYDTKGRNQAESYTKWKNDKYYYVNNNYEAVAMMQNPENEIKIISDVTKYPKYYKTHNQRGDIKSTVLYCFDTSEPLVIVITSNMKNIFKENDEKLRLLIESIGIALTSIKELSKKHSDENWILLQ